MVNMIELSDEIKRELAFSEEEKKELEKAGNMPITFDEDCPETTPERALRFRRVNGELFDPGLEDELVHYHVILSGNSSTIRLGSGTPDHAVMLPEL